MIISTNDCMNQIKHKSKYDFDIFFTSACQAKSSAKLQGVCYTPEECSKKKGTKDGNCAASFGVCCVIRYFKH